MKSKGLIKELKKAGWKLDRTNGSHNVFKKDGESVTVPHPKKDLPIGTVKAIRKKAKLEDK